MQSEPKRRKSEAEVIEARRQFLSACGKFAIATPPAVALLLSAAKRNYAVASSGTQQNGQHGHDDHGHDDHGHDDHSHSNNHH